MIYFIQVGRTGPIKIGIAKKDVMGRLYCLQSSSPWKLRLLGVQLGDREEERDLHAKFAGIRKRGEWFKPHESLLNYIEEFSQPLLAMEPELLPGGIVRYRIGKRIWKVVEDLRSGDYDAIERCDPSIRSLVVKLSNNGRFHRNSDLYMALNANDELVVTTDLP